MTTWILVIFIAGWNAQTGSVTHVPGYASEAECRAAGKAMKAETNFSYPYCIPGPKH